MPVDKDGVYRDYFGYECYLGTGLARLKPGDHSYVPPVSPLTHDELEQAKKHADDLHEHDSSQ